MESRNWDKRIPLSPDEFLVLQLPPHCLVEAFAFQLEIQCKVIWGPESREDRERQQLFLSLYNSPTNQAPRKRGEKNLKLAF